MPALTQGSELERLMRLVWLQADIIESLVYGDAGPVEPDADLLTTKQAAECVNVTRDTIYNWIRAGKVRSSRPTHRGNGIVVDRASLVAYAEVWRAGNSA